MDLKWQNQNDNFDDILYKFATLLGRWLAGRFSLVATSATNWLPLTKDLIKFNRRVSNFSIFVSWFLLFCYCWSNRYGLFDRSRRWSFFRKLSLAGDSSCDVWPLNCLVNFFSSSSCFVKTSISTSCFLLLASMLVIRLFKSVSLCTWFKSVASLFPSFPNSTANAFLERLYCRYYLFLLTANSGMEHNLRARYAVTTKISLLGTSSWPFLEHKY